MRAHDIENLRSRIRDYFWSESGDSIKVGGHDGGRYYGNCEFKFSTIGVLISRTTSDGVSSSSMLADLPYSRFTLEFESANALRREVQEYLADDGNRIYQEANRGQLMLNTLGILPTHH